MDEQDTADAVPSSDPAEATRLGINSVENAAKVLSAMAENGGVLPLRAIAAAAGMSRTKTHRYLVSLTRAGLTQQDPASGNYGLGPLAVTVGLVGLKRLSTVDFALEALPSLRDASGETAVLAIWGGNGPTVIAFDESVHPVTLNVRLGSVLPLYKSAIGRVYLAFGSAATTGSAWAKADEDRADRERLETIVQEAKDKGYASVESELLAGVNAVAAPVFDYRGALCLVVGLVGRQETLSIDPNSIAVHALLDGASLISRTCGFTG